jgi:hypothetical protein
MKTIKEIQKDILTGKKFYKSLSTIPLPVKLRKGTKSEIELHSLKQASLFYDNFVKINNIASTL